MSELPYDLQQSPTETDEPTPALDHGGRSARLHLLVAGVIVGLSTLLFVLFFQISRIQMQIKALAELPVADLQHYTAFQRDISGFKSSMVNQFAETQQELALTKGRIDQIELSISTLTPALSADRDRLAAMEKRLDQLEQRLVDQRKAAAVLQRKLAEQPRVARTARTGAASGEMKLYSLRSFGTVPAARLTSSTGDVSPLMRVGDRWLGWEFVRIDGRSAIFTLNGVEQGLTL